MKILCIADTHYGVRGDNPHFYDYQKKFFHNVVFPFIDKFDIRVVFHLGDLVDNRKSLNYQTLSRMRSDFLDPFSTLDVDSHWIPGNHDSYFRNTLSINAMQEFIKVGKVYNDFESISIDGCNIDFVPWICSDTYDESIRRIRESTSQYCMGHLELLGFPNNNGLLSNGGEDRAIFNSYDKVLSGHFHKRSRQDNICYIGSCFEFTWSDWNDYRGMSIFDTSDGSLRYFRNPYNIFSVINFDSIDDSCLKKVKDTYCRLVIKEKVDISTLNDTIKRIEDIGVINLTIDDRSVMMPTSPEKPQQGESLHNLITRHIDSLQLDNHLKVKQKFDELYTRADK